jgi:glycosyltransferase involved in cell wall biosynthesis
MTEIYQLTKTNILVVTLAPIFPPDSGGKKYTFTQFSHTNGKYVNHLLACTEFGEKVHYSLNELNFDSLSFCKIARSSNRYVKSIKKLLLSLFGFPFLELNLFSFKLILSVRRKIRELNIDILELHSTHLIYLARFVNCKTLVVSQNIESDIFDFPVPSGLGLGARYRKYISLKSKLNSLRVERLNFFSVDAVTCISNKDLKKLYNYPIQLTLPPVISTSDPGPKSGKKKLLWVGGTDWHPNLVSLDWLLNCVVPHLLNLIPPDIYEFHFCGKGTEKFQNSFKNSDNFYFHGYVSDIDEYFSKSEILCAPVIVGGGVNYKILEAMGAGLAVVTTPLAAEAIATDYSSIILAEKDPLRFALAIRSLLVTDSLRMMLQRESREYISLYHNEVLGRRIKDDVYERLMEMTKKL